MSGGNKICEVYATFNTCQYGSGCKNTHQNSVHRQSFIIATVLDRQSGTNVISMKNFQTNGIAEFYVRKGSWFIANAKRGDVVLFQKSDQKLEVKERGTKREYEQGRVVMILQAAGSRGNNAAMWTNFAAISLPSCKSVYTLDPKGTKRFDNAYSVDSCSDKNHSGCEMIGVHVCCAALGNRFKIEESEIPSNCPTGKWLCPSYSSYNLTEQHFGPAMSVYFHTTSSEVTKPEVCVVRVEKNYEFGDQNVMHFDTLWNHFVKEEEIMKDISWDSDLRKYLTLFPTHWKEYYLTDKMMRSFKLAVKGLREPWPMFIRKVWNQNTMGPFGQKSVTIFKDLWSGTEEKNLALTAAGIRYKVSQESVPSLLPKYRWSAESFNDSDHKDDVVPCTAPLRNIIHYVNQQVTLNHLLNSGRRCYTKEELLGILGIRFETPTLQIAFVRKLGSDTAELEYQDLLNTPDSLYEAPYSVFTDRQIGRDHASIPIAIQGIDCPANEFFNRDIVSLEESRLERLLSRNTAEDLQDLTPERSPYTENDNGITLTLQAGIELRMQISIKDAERHHPLRWRLLRIAPNRHLCFTHLNDPELAFGSLRVDVQDLVTSQRIEHLKKADRHQRQGTTIDGMVIGWHDYYSRGQFDVDDQKVSVQQGSLLCIRKEISDDEDVKYVWSCHGVVSKKTKSEVHFMVCTLSQTETPTESEGGFVVEVINTACEEQAYDQEPK